MNQKIIQWVRQNAKRLKLNQDKLGKIIDVSQPQISERLNEDEGTDFSFEEIKLLEQHFGEPCPIGERNMPQAGDYIVVNEFNVHASAGDGALISEENVISKWPFEADYIQNELRLHKSQLVLLEVRGDSMYPTLSSGDRIMVNLSDTQVSQPGIFVLFDGDGTVVKRVEKKYGEDTLILISDNEIHKRYNVSLSDVKVAGRVVWAAKRL